MNTTEENTPPVELPEPGDAVDNDPAQTAKKKKNKSKRKPKGKTANRPPEDPETIVRRYKTRLCQNFVKTGKCPFFSRCRFAHGSADMRTPDQNRADKLFTEDAIDEFVKFRTEQRKLKQERRTARRSEAQNHQAGAIDFISDAAIHPPSQSMSAGSDSSTPGDSSDNDKGTTESTPSGAVAASAMPLPSYVPTSRTSPSLNAAPAPAALRGGMGSPKPRVIISQDDKGSYNQVVQPSQPVHAGPPPQAAYRYNPYSFPATMYAYGPEGSTGFYQHFNVPVAATQVPVAAIHTTAAPQSFRNTPYQHRVKHGQTAVPRAPAAHQQQPSATHQHHHAFQYSQYQQQPAESFSHSQ